MFKKIFYILSLFFYLNSFGSSLSSESGFIGKVFPHSNIFRDNIRGLYSLACGASKLLASNLYEHFIKCDACNQKLNESASCSHCKEIFLENCNEMEKHFSMCNYAKSNSAPEPTTRCDTELDLIASRSFMPIRPMTSLSTFTTGSSEISSCTYNRSSLGNTASESAAQSVLQPVTPVSEEASYLASDEVLNQDLQQQSTNIPDYSQPCILSMYVGDTVIPMPINPYDRIRSEMKNRAIMHQNDNFLLAGTLKYIDESSDEEIALMWQQEQELSEYLGGNNG